MRLKVTFVIGLSASLRTQWLRKLRYAEVAAALNRRHIQMARAIYFGARVQEALPLILAEQELPSHQPSVGHGHNLSMGLQLAHTLAGTAPTLVVVVHDLIGLSSSYTQGSIQQAPPNITHLFAVHRNGEGGYNHELAAKLTTPSNTAVLRSSHPDANAAALDEFLTGLNHAQLGRSA